MLVGRLGNYDSSCAWAGLARSGVGQDFSRCDRVGRVGLRDRQVVVLQLGKLNDAILVLRLCAALIDSP